LLSEGESWEGNIEDLPDVSGKAITWRFKVPVSCSVDGQQLVESRESAVLFVVVSISGLSTNEDQLDGVEFSGGATETAGNVSIFGSPPYMALTVPLRGWARTERGQEDLNQFSRRHDKGEFNHVALTEPLHRR
jgi:hypothetical protein